jgi:HEAT repeat protein
LDVLPLAGNDAVPALANVAVPSSDPDSALRVVAALAALGPHTLEQQRAQFENFPPDVQQYVLEGLRTSVDDQADPLLVSLVVTPTAQPEVLLAAIQQLGANPIEPVTIVPMLLAIAQAPVADLELRNAAVVALGNYNAAAVEALPFLRSLLESGEQSSRSAAAVALAKIDPGDLQILAALTTMLSSCDAATESAATALGGVGIVAQAAAPSLIDALACPEPANVAAAGALASIAPPSQAVIDALAPLTNGDEQVARTAVTALGRLGLPAAPVLISVLMTVTSDAIWQQTSDTLAGMGAAAAPALVETLSSDGLAPEVSSKLIQTLGKIGPAAVPFVLRGLQSDALSSPARDRLVETLFVIGPHSLAALDWVMQSHPEAINPTRFEQVFGTFDTRSDGSIVTKGFAVPGALGFLITSLRDTTGAIELRWQAARVLGFLGPEAAAATPLLAQALADADEGLRCEAALALLLIGPDTGAAAPALAKALEAADPNTMCVLDGDSKQLGGLRCGLAPSSGLCSSTEQRTTGTDRSRPAGQGAAGRERSC